MPGSSGGVLNGGVGIFGPLQRIASDMMNPRSPGIACHMVLTSLTPYVADVLLCTNNSVAGAMLLILGTAVTHLIVA